MTRDTYGGAGATADGYGREANLRATTYGLAPVGGDDSVRGFLRGRQESLERMTSSVGSLVSERQRLSAEVLAGIDQDDLDLGNLILMLYRPGQAVTDNPAYTKLRVERMRLGRERRQELVSCWRDTALLGKDLAELEGRVESSALANRLLEREKM